jgi:Zn-finger nucleic acid-binding protein
MKCPNCGSEVIPGTVIAEFITIPWKCPKCRCVWTDWQQAEIDRLRAVLREIEEHEHCKDGIGCRLANGKDAASMSWAELTELGHRCAAEIARKGLGK